MEKDKAGKSVDIVNDKELFHRPKGYLGGPTNQTQPLLIEQSMNQTLHPQSRTMMSMMGNNTTIDNKSATTKFSNQETTARTGLDKSQLMLAQAQNLR